MIYVLIQAANVEGETRFRFIDRHDEAILVGNKEWLTRDEVLAEARRMAEEQVQADVSSAEQLLASARH